MPRSNRPRGRRVAESHDEDVDLSRVLSGRLHTEGKRDGDWNVQPISAASAAKSYVCPGCTLEIAPSTAHIVAWRADLFMGDSVAVADRRHWHSHCWKIKN